MKFKWIILSLSVLALSGCGGTVSEQRTVDELNYMVKDLKGAAEKAELRLAQLESTNIKLEEQNDKLMLLKKKMELNAEYIEELRSSAFEVMPPDDLKVVKLTSREVAEDNSKAKKKRVKKFSSIPKLSTNASRPAPVKASKLAPVNASKPAPVKTAKPAPVKASKQAPVKMAKQAPVKTARQAPVKTAKPAPVKAAKPAPVKASRQAPVKTARPAPVKTAKQAPVKVAKATSGVITLKDKPSAAKHASAEDLKGSVEELYQRGLDANFAGEYERSREIFNMLVIQYPNHNLADNALYWSGETYFSAKEFQKAIKKFTEVVKRYPKENKTPDALLKAGISFLELEKPVNAKKILEKVIALYPNSEAAATAQDKLGEL